MKVELSIKDDKELRYLIKDMIRGAVTSVIRNEIKEMTEKQLSVEMDKKLKEITGYEVRKRLRDEHPNYKQEVSDAIKEKVNETIEEHIFQKAVAMLNRDNQTIEKMITDKLNNLSFKLS